MLWDDSGVAHVETISTPQPLGSFWGAIAGSTDGGRIVLSVPEAETALLQSSTDAGRTWTTDTRLDGRYHIAALVDDRILLWRDVGTRPVPLGDDVIREFLYYPSMTPIEPPENATAQVPTQGLPNGEPWWYVADGSQLKRTDGTIVVRRPGTSSNGDGCGPLMGSIVRLSTGEFVASWSGPDCLAGSGRSCISVLDSSGNTLRTFVSNHALIRPPTNLNLVIIHSSFPSIVCESRAVPIPPCPLNLSIFNPTSGTVLPITHPFIDGPYADRSGPTVLAIFESR